MQLEQFARRPQTNRKGSKARPPQRYREVLITLRRIIRAIDLHSKQLEKQSGLTIPQIVLLQSIEDLGEVTTRQLSEQVELSQGTVTTILDRLEARGLIERYRSTIDRRIVHSRLTVQGGSRLRGAPPLLHERFVARFSARAAADQKRILTAMQEVAAMMDAGDLDAAPILHTAPVRP